MYLWMKFHFWTWPLETDTHHCCERPADVHRVRSLHYVHPWILQSILRVVQNLETDVHNIVLKLRQTETKWRQTCEQWSKKKENLFPSSWCHVTGVFAGLADTDTLVYPSFCPPSGPWRDKPLFVWSPYILTPLVQNFPPSDRLISESNQSPRVSAVTLLWQFTRASHWPRPTQARSGHHKCVCMCTSTCTYFKDSNRSGGVTFTLRTTVLNSDSTGITVDGWHSEFRRFSPLSLELLYFYQI